MSALPVKQDVPVERNRLTVFFRIILAIPGIIVAYVYGLIAFVAVIIAWFSIVFTGKYPAACYRAVTGNLHYSARLQGYFLLRHDEFPPFDREPHPEFPTAIALPERQESYDRVKTAFRLILAIPVFAILYVFQIWSQLIAIGAWFCAVFTGKTPPGLNEAGRMPFTYMLRAWAYIGLITETWPPFDAGPNSLQLEPATT